MNVEDLTVRQAREIAAMFHQPVQTAATTFDNGMVGMYVIVRCRDAGVHAGILVKHGGTAGRECVLRDSRRLYYWKPAKGKWLSAVAMSGLDDSSMVSVVTPLIHLTENCEIILCTDVSAMSIRAMAASEPDD